MSWLDYLFLFGLLGVSMTIGIYHSCSGGKQRTTQEFILNNRRLRVLPTIMSTMVSYISAYSVLGSGAEVYMWGMRYGYTALITIPLTLLLIERVFVPVIFNLKLTSIYEYVDLRFHSRFLKLTASGMGVCFSVMFMGMNIYGPAIALETATGFSMKISMGLLAGVAALYTSLGGIRAVIWADVLQFIILEAGLIFLIASGAHSVGGIGNVFKAAHEMGRLDFASFSVDPTERVTFWNVMLYLLLFSIFRYGLDQSAVQRYSNQTSLTSARAVLFGLVPAVFFTQTLCHILALVVFAYFSSIRCDPFQSQLISSPNEVVPLFVRLHFSDHIGVQGLFLALIFSVSLSTISSCLGGCAANTWVDLLKPFLPPLTEKQGALINRFLVLVYAVLATCIAVFMATWPGNMIRFLGISASAFSGPLLALYILGMCFKRVNWQGAAIGCFTGFVFSLWISLGSLYVPSKSKPLLPVLTDGCLEFMNKSQISCQQFPAILISNWTSNTQTDGATTYGTTHQSSQENIYEGHANPLYTLSFFWFIVVAFVTTLVTGILSSEILHLAGLAKVHPVDKQVLIDWRAVFSCCCWMNKEIRKSNAELCNEEVCSKENNLQKKNCEIPMDTHKHSDEGNFGQRQEPTEVDKLVANKVSKP